MEQVKSILDKVSATDNKITRFPYMPYSEKISKHVWFGIATTFIEGLKVGAQQAKIWSQLIKYVHGDSACEFDLTKGICLIGGTGSSKTKTMEIMNEYIKIDAVVYMRGKQQLTFNFRTITSKEIISSYLAYGYDGILNYMNIGNLCIDDLGSEAVTANYYGTKLDVLTEIVETRYNKGLLTHFTTNLDEEEINERYNSRVYSRIKHSCNIIEMNDCDFRISE